MESWRTSRQLTAPREGDIAGDEVAIMPEEQFELDAERVRSEYVTIANSLRTDTVL